MIFLPPGKKRSVNKLLWLVVALLAGVYLLNFTFGVLEVPDNLPVVGNLDEVAVSGVLFTALRMLGLDITGLIK